MITYLRLIGVFCFLGIGTNAQSYDPLKTSDSKITTWENVVQDRSRNRDIPIKVYLPETSTNAPVILFSHGLGGSKENSPYLGNHWASHGYLCVFMQHEGSDERVWKGKGPAQAMRSMKQAASAQNFILRVKDVPVVINQLEIWNKTQNHPLYDRMDLNRMGMSGHSFGAVTTQALSGEEYPTGSYADSRIKAAIPLSPSLGKGRNAGRAFGKVKIPWLLMTGTKDEVGFLGSEVESRMVVYPALPPGSKYEVVLKDAEHSAFGDYPTGRRTESRNPNHHRVILAISTAFLDAYLKEDASAKAWLDGNGPTTILEKEDRWQKK